MDSDHSGRPHVVIVGGGFAGLNAARALAAEALRVTVVDRRNHHLFQPLLYQVATAALSPADIAAPIRSILRRQANARVILADVQSVDLDAKVVVLSDGRIDYDYLLLAAGATHSYFGHPEWEERAPGLKTIEDALEIRRRMLLAYEHAERERDETERQALLTFVIVGAGPTGVEMAGAMSEIARMTLAADFREIDLARTRVLLLEAGPRILPSFTPGLADKARRSLEELGVEVRTDEAVTEMRTDGVVAGGGFIPARTIVWAAGVQAAPLSRTLGAELDRAGRVIVTPALSIAGRPEVFVAGDLAAFAGADGRQLPGVAPVAIQQGVVAARNIARLAAGVAPENFCYRDRGSLATIGRAAGVADFGWLKLSGFVAWMAWLFVHIYFLIGFQNKLLVMIQWSWSYFFRHRGARLITTR